MRITALVIEQEVKKGTSAGSGKPYSLHLLRILEQSRPGRKVLRDPLDVTLTDDDNDLIGTLQGKVVAIDITGMKGGKYGVECKGFVVRSVATEIQSEDVTAAA
jgi:hypothetical protein